MACFAPFFCLLAQRGRGLVTWLWAGCTKLARVWGLGAFAEDQTVLTENKACFLKPADYPPLLAAGVWFYSPPVEGCPVGAGWLPLGLYFGTGGLASNHPVRLRRRPLRRRGITAKAAAMVLFCEFRLD